MSGSGFPGGSADADGDEVPILWYVEPSGPVGPSRRPPTRILLIALAVVVVLAVVVTAAVKASGRGGDVAAAQAASSSPATTGAADPTAATGSPEESSSSTTSGAPDFSSAAAAVSPSLVRVVASTCQGTGSGTGFWIDDETVLTSYQSVSKNVSVAIIDQENRPVPAVVYGADPEHGVALLHVDGVAAGPALDISSTAPQVQDPLAVVGFPSKSDDIATHDGEAIEGDIGFEHHGLSMRGYEALPGSLDLSLGGAPVVDPQGVVKGIVFAVTAQPRRLFVPADQVRTGIDVAQTSGSPDPGRCKKPTGPYSQTRITGHPSAAMRRGLMTYFGGINSAQYDVAYDAGMGPNYHRTEGSPAKGWVSTYDFNIKVHRPKSKHKAWVTFDSIFANGKGPVEGLTCARWSFDYTFTELGGDLVINRNKAHGSGSGFEPC